MRTGAQPSVAGSPGLNPRLASPADQGPLFGQSSNAKASVGDPREVYIADDGLPSIFLEAAQQPHIVTAESRRPSAGVAVGRDRGTGAPYS